MMNGMTKVCFQSRRGLRQWDNLFSHLFIILQDILSRLIKQSVEAKRFGHFSQARGSCLISHLMYADDVVIFTNGGRKSIRCLLNILCKYEDWSGQMICKEKMASSIINFPWLKDELLKEYGLKLPFKYLGVPIVLGRLKTSDLEELVSKVHKKISNWKIRLLSMGERVWLCILLRLWGRRCSTRVVGKTESTLQLISWSKLR